MVGAKIGIDESSKKDLFTQIQEIFKQIEDKSIELKIDDKNLLNQIKDVKSAIDILQEQKNIELNLEGLDKIQADFKSANTAITSFKEQLKSITNSKDITIKINDEQAIATIKTLEGQIKKVKFTVDRDDNTNIIKGFTLDEQNPVQSLVDKSSQQELKQSIKEQNDLYMQASKLLKEKYQLIDAINSAEKKGYSLLSSQLTELKEENQLKLNQITPQLNDENNNKIINQEIALIDKKNSKITETIEKNQQENESIQKQIEQYKKDMEIKLQNLNSTGKNALNSNEIKSEIQAIKDALNGLDVGNYEDNVKKINTQLKQTQANVREINTEANKTKGMFGEILSNIGKMALWGISGTAIFGSLNELKQGISFINDLNKAETNIQMITGSTKAQTDSMTQSYSNLAGQLHETTSNMMEASEEFLRAGNNAKNTKELLKSSTVMSKIAGESQADSSEQLISIMNAYHLNAKDMMGVVDKLVAVDNNAATSTSELATAMQKVSSTAMGAGIPMEKLISWIGTISSVTRDSASTIGTALNSIISRYQSIKEGKNFDPDNNPFLLAA